jgi:hypothetical protein
MSGNTDISVRRRPVATLHEQYYGGVEWERACGAAMTPRVYNQYRAPTSPSPAIFYPFGNADFERGCKSASANIGS